MSIVIPLGVTTPDTSYSDMAAGSDPESVEASPAVAEKNSYSNHNYGSAQHHGYRGLPYADHNYGAPPPPTPPASPPPQTIIARVELNRLRCQRYDENSEDSDSSSEDENIPWCHCSLTQDGFIIACENCRRLDRRKVIRLQRRKQENVSGGESSATESGDEEVSPSTVSYTATQHTPTSITLTVNRVKRTKAKKRKRSTEKARNAPKAKKIKAFREGSRRSMRMKNSLSEAHALDENTAEGWENRIRLWTDQYEEAFANQYSADVQNLLELHRLTVKDSVGKNAVLDTINKTELACNNTILGSQMQLQLGKVTRVQRHRKILRAARDLTPDMLIIEYRGKVMLRQQFEVNGHFFKRPYPFVLFYPKFNEVEMCVDARTFGNDARFIRRSCAPNAEVLHMIADGMIHLCIYAITNIPKDSEVTIGFDYEYSSCKYKVDCACHKGNQNCPVQKHNQGSMEPPVGAETRRRKARRKEWEMELELNHASDDNSNQQQDEQTECKDQAEAPAQIPASDSEEGLVDGAGIKLEENEESEMDEHLRAQNKLSREQRKMEAIMQVFENLEKRKKRREQVVEHSTSHPGVDTSPETPTTHVEEEKVEPAADEPLAAGAGTPQIVPAGVGTRRTSQLGEQVPEKPVKPPAPKPTKPRPKNRFSRYRSSSAQRLRRQRQASSQSEPAPVVSVEEGTLGAVTLQDPTAAEGVVSAGVPAVESTSGIAVITQVNRTNIKYPKTKRYLVSEWLNDKVERPECPYDRPLRITTDPTVLATTLNMLPGLSHSPHICTTPKHYIRFGSPFTPEKRRQRVVCDGNYGSCKKRWIRQAMDEAMVQSPHTPDVETEPPTFYQSSDASNLPDLPPNTDTPMELITPLKKRKSRYLSDTSVSDLPGGCSPLSAPASVSDTVMSSPTVVTPCTLFPGEEEKKNEYSVPCSPLHSLAASRCNTPLQFENISSPETSPVHRPEPLSPEPPLRTDYDQSRTGLSDLSLHPGLDTPPFQVTGVNDVSLSDCAELLSNAPLTFPCDTEAGIAGKSSDIHSPIKNTEQAFRTEFNLIYACSPLNSNLRDLTPTHRLEGPYRGLENRTSYVSDRKSSQLERGFGDTVYNSLSGDSCFTKQSLGHLAETLQGSLSPQADRQALYPEGNTISQQNPPQKKKVSLLEYRKRQQEAKGSGSKSDSLDPCRTARGGGTPTRRGSDCSSAQTPTNGDSGAISRSSHRSSSPPSGFSSPVHPSMPQIEDVSPTDSNSGKNATLSATSTSKSRDSMSTRWMVPTSVERLREDRGMLERVLRRVEIGSIKRTGDERGTLDRVLRRVETGAADSVREKDTDSIDGDGLEAQGPSRTKGSPIHSPQRYSHSPSRYNHQLLQVQSEGHSGESHTLPQQSMSPYRTHSSSNASSAHAQGHVYRSSSQVLGQSGSQSQPDSSLTGAPLSTLYSSPIHSTSADTSVVQYVGSSGYYSGQQQSASVLHTFSNTQQKTNSTSSHSTAASPLQNTTKSIMTDSTHPRPPSPANATASQTARPCQSGLRTLNPASSGQPLHSGTKLTTAASSQHYRSSTGVAQYQPSQVQSTSLRTQPSTY